MIIVMTIPNYVLCDLNMFCATFLAILMIFHKNGNHFPRSTKVAQPPTKVAIMFQDPQNSIKWADKSSHIYSTHLPCTILKGVFPINCWGLPHPPRSLIYPIQEKFKTRSVIFYLWCHNYESLERSLTRLKFPVSRLIPLS